MSDRNGYDARSEDARLDRRITEESEIAHQRDSAHEAELIGVQSQLSSVGLNLAIVNTNVNNLRHSFQLRFDRFEQMLELVLRSKGIPVPVPK